MKLLFFALSHLFSGTDTLKNESYEMVIPANWTIKSNCSPNDCSLLAPQDHNQDTFLENIHIFISPSPSPTYTVDKNIDYSEGYLPTIIDNFKLLERKKISNTASYIIYSGTKDESVQKWKQYYFYKNKNAYIITFSSEQTTFDDYIKVVQPALDSFKIY